RQPSLSESCGVLARNRLKAPPKSSRGHSVETMRERVHGSSLFALSVNVREVAPIFNSFLSLFTTLMLRVGVGADDTNVDSMLFKFLEKLLRKPRIRKCQMNFRALSKTDHAIMAELRGICENISLI